MGDLLEFTLRQRLDLSAGADMPGQSGSVSPGFLHASIAIVNVGAALFTLQQMSHVYDIRCICRRHGGDMHPAQDIVAAPVKRLSFGLVL